MSWDVVSDKIPKPVVNKKTAGGKDTSKVEGKDFHYVYVLTKKKYEPKTTKDKADEIKVRDEEMS